MVVETVSVRAVVEAVQGVEGVIGESDLLRGLKPLHEVRVGLV